MFAKQKRTCLSECISCVCHSCTCIPTVHKWQRYINSIHVCSSFFKNFLWRSLIYRLPSKRGRMVNKHNQTCSFVFAAKSTLGECTRSLRLAKHIRQVFMRLYTATSNIRFVFTCLICFLFAVRCKPALMIVAHARCANALFWWLWCPRIIQTRYYLMIMCLNIVRLCYSDDRDACALSDPLHDFYLFSHKRNFRNLWKTFQKIHFYSKTSALKFFFSSFYFHHWQHWHDYPSASLADNRPQ